MARRKKKQGAGIKELRHPYSGGLQATCDQLERPVRDLKVMLTPFHRSYVESEASCKSD